MSAEGVRALIDRAESDEAFRERILAMSPEEKRQAIREAGFDVDRSDLPTIRSAVAFELSDAELERVSLSPGGSITAVTIAASVAAAAAAG